MNEQNLIPGNRRSQSEARENGRKGGQASGRARREKKAVKQVILDALYSTAPSGMTVMEEMISGMIERVIQNGDQQTFEKVMEYAGMSPERKRKDAELKLKKAQIEITEHSGYTGDDPCLAVLEQIRGAMKDAADNQ